MINLQIVKAGNKSPKRSRHSEIGPLDTRLVSKIQSFNYKDLPGTVLVDNWISKHTLTSGYERHYAFHHKPPLVSKTSAQTPSWFCGISVICTTLSSWLWRDSQYLPSPPAPALSPLSLLLHHHLEYLLRLCKFHPSNR